MNQHIKTMKDILTSYHQKAKKADDAIRKAQKEYKPEIASKMVEQIKAELLQEKVTAIDAITKASKQGKADLEKWYELNPADITDDAKLLQAGIPITQADFDSLCMKYQNNGTMCRILDEYAKCNNRKAQASHPSDIFPEGYLHTMNLPNVKTMTEKWDHLASKAEGIINSMDGHGYGYGANDPIVSMNVQGFGGNDD